MECDDIHEKFKNIGGWDQTADERDAYSKLFKFVDFKQAFSFMTSIAMKAEQINHHPEWDNVYKTVNVLLTTHDKGTITNLDVTLAQKMDNIYES